MSNLVLDGDAQRQVLAAKGAMGKLPCLGCLNVVRDQESLPSHAFVTIANYDASRLELSTNQDVWEKADMLHSNRPPRMRKPAFEQLETAIGLRYEPEGLLNDMALRPHLPIVDVITFDSMHIILCNGMADDEFAALFFTSLADVCTWDDMRNFMKSDFRFNKHPHSKMLAGV